MSITSTLQDTKARLDSLLEYANETTGQSDVSIGDAIKTLADGFGGGGDNKNFFVHTFTEQIATSASGSNIVIPHNLGKIPTYVDVEYIGTINYTTPIVKWGGNGQSNYKAGGSTNGSMSISNANVDQHPVSSADAVFCRADANNIYLFTGSWGGTVLKDSRYAVYVE